MARRVSVGLLLLTLALAACARPLQSTSTSEPGGGGASSSSTIEPSQSPAAMPGRPYDAEAVLAGMRDSQRPGGVPDQLETNEIADAVSRELWTWDGTPWKVLAIGGACGPKSCSLEVAGSRENASGADLYSFVVDPARQAVSISTTDLHAYPGTLDTPLTAAAQAAAGESLDGLAFVGASWLPPPDAGRYWLAYRSGGEEGAPGLDVLIELASGRLIEKRPV
jgi:hypothetical protein